MSASRQVNLPIYARLVEERGDVPADARQTAEETWRRVSAVMDFGLAPRRQDAGRRPAR